MSDANRQSGCGLRLPASVREALIRDDRRIVIVGASGWVGQTATTLFDEALGEAVTDRLVCVGSKPREIALPSGRLLHQLALDDLSTLASRPTLLLHFAFLTKDKVAQMSRDDYVGANRRLSRCVLDALDPIGVDRLFLASSGAAAFASDPNAAEDLRLYGELKRKDETDFATWADSAPAHRRAAICRLYSVSGPYINKHATYALADFILRGLRGEPVAVSASHEVWRSYVAVNEVIALALALLLNADGNSVQSFETGGNAIELGTLAGVVAAELGVCTTSRTAVTGPSNRYCGDHGAWLDLLQRHGLTHAGLPKQVRDTAAYLAALE